MAQRRAAHRLEAQRRAAHRLAILHPVPSSLAAVAAGGLAAVAGAEPRAVLLLVSGMFGFQASIGALNDVIDAERDGSVRSDKPIPAGLVSVRTALTIAVAGAAIGLVVSASFGWPVLLVGIVGLLSGYAYDLVARSTGWGWLAFAVALPALVAWAWLAAVATLPPGWEVLLPLAALAGPAVHLANSMADAPSDQETGATSLAIRLGTRRSRIALLGLDVMIWALGWLTLLLLGAFSVGVLLAMVAATALAAVGALLSVNPRTASSDLGWTLGAVALAILAVLWVANVSAT